MIEWKYQILALRENYFTLKFPHLAKDHGIPRARPYRDDSVKDLLRSIIDWICFSGGAARQTNAPGRVYKLDGKLTRVQHTGRKFFDVIAVYRSQEINIKILKEGRVHYHHGGGNAGALYCQVRNMEEFVEWWETNPAKLGDSDSIPSVAPAETNADAGKTYQLPMAL